MDKNLKFRALYYPYSRCMYENDLKRAVLVFDEIYFVDPLVEDITGEPGQVIMPPSEAHIGWQHINPFRQRFHLDYYHPKSTVKKISSIPYPTAAWYEIKSLYSLLAKHEIIKLVRPNDYISEPLQDLMTFSVLKSLCHDRGLDQLEYRRPKSLINGPIFWADEVKWRLHRSRIPASLAKLIHEDDLLGSLVQQESKNRLSKKQISDRVAFLKKGLSSITQELEKTDSCALLLPVRTAHDLIIHQALLLCDELEAFPITDDILSHDMLLSKIAQLYDSSDNMIRSILPKPVSPRLYSVQSFTLSVVSRLIPDEALSRVSMKQIIAYRKSNAEALGRFQEKMLEFSAEITSKPWSDDFHTTVLRILDSVISPEIRRLEDQLKDSYQQLFGHIIGKLGSQALKIIAPAIPTMTMATVFGLTPGQIALISAASIVSGLGLVLPDIVQNYRARSMPQKNGIAFLLKFRDRHLVS